MDAEAIAILREIRDEVRQTNSRLDQTNSRLDQTNSRLDQTNAKLDQTTSRLDQANAKLNQMDTRLDAIETTLVDLAEQQRFVVRYLKGLRDRDSRLEADVIDLRQRVEVLERDRDPG